MKKIIKIATLTAIIALSVAMVAACNKVESINIKSANLPNQLIYVAGSDLNLAGGSLSVVGKKETTLIELESPGVTVSGYDKNKIGQQEVTVSYEGKTTTFSVTVVPRMVAENIELDYFVGDEFNDKGRLRITRDDGTAFTVPVNDEAITVTGFDSSVAKAPLTVTATYNESGVTYTGTFNVNIYDVSETDFKAPTKKDYLSHEAGIDLSGSYFTIKGGVGGALTRYIEVTDDMIEGFDLSAADISNKETPLDQKVTVKYGGEEYYFNVNITYTNVSYIKDNLETFADLDWSEKLPDVSTRVGEVAISLWNAYTTLEDSEKALLTEEEKLAFVRPAVVYSYNLWVAEITAYPNSFNALTTGPQLVCTTYNDAVKGYEVLTDPENILAVAGAIIKGIDAEFSQSVLCGTNLISTLSSIVYTKETMDKFAGYIEYMITLYDALKDVPAEWTSQSLADYASDIQAATEIILNSEYKTSEYSAFYDRVSSWRENNDYIDILYAYFYYVEKNEDVLYSLQKVRLPGVLEELYTVITSAMNQISS
ncbi:MAG: bacterial Ig-like domain-containing protein, partial [Clostridia bacterium]|nr:bacterial Ig-like domain-containing protein [Clostridia bacterium]